MLPAMTSELRHIHTRDKWEEAIYHARLMLKSFKDYTNLSINDNEQQKHLKAFRYNFNAFVNSSRAVTFVLQKVYRHDHGFIEWYTIRRNALTSNDFAKRIVELRNLNQKEGNMYPMIQYTVNINNRLEIDRVMSQVPIKIGESIIESFELNSDLKFYRIICDSESEIREIDPPDGMSIEDIIENYKMEILQDHVDEVSRNIERINEEGIKMKITEKKVFLSPNLVFNYDEFLKHILENLNELSAICKEASEKFI